MVAQRRDVGDLELLPLLRRGSLGSEVNGFVEFWPSLGLEPLPTQEPKPASIHHVTIERPETLVEFVGALQVRKGVRVVGGGMRVAFIHHVII